MYQVMRSLSDEVIIELNDDMAAILQTTFADYIFLYFE